ncbi:golvesin C-terminal-like domain-containing protein [Crossiella sp. NPDC003009]
MVDDVPDDAPVVRPECAAHQWRSEGEFTLDFASDAKGLYPSKVDFHQIGAGFGGHFWFGHTRKSGDEGGKLKTTGTWTLNRGLPGWTRVLVHLPDHGAHTQQAHYEIDTGTGSFTKDRYLSQAGLANRWVSLGVYQLSGTPRVRLSTVTQDGYGKEDVAYDAVAFQPLPGKPRHIVAALGDSFSSGEGAKDYYRETDNNHGTAQWAACRRSRNAWARKLVLPGFSGGLGKLADEWHPNAELGFIACSGAKSWHARGKAGVEVVRDVFPTSWLKPAEYETGDGQFREIAQVKSGVLDEHTTLVVLSIGGNDGDTFAKALATCVTPVSPCQDTLVRDWGPVIRTHMPEMVATVKEIAAKAPNAQIMLMGYPPLFSDKTTCAGAQTVSLEEAKAANKLAEEMANIQRAAVEETARRGIKVAYADSAAEFKDHGGCDETPYINNISIGPNGPGDFHSGDRSSLFCIPLTGKCISRESFHPNAVGTTGLAWAMEAALRRVRYGEPGPPVLGAG